MGLMFDFQGEFLNLSSRNIEKSVSCYLKTHLIWYYDTLGNLIRLK